MVSNFTKMSATPQKRNFSSKSASKSPNFHSLKTNFNSKSQNCRTSSKLKKPGPKKSGLYRKIRRKNNYSTNAPTPAPIKQNLSYTTFDSHKVFSCYTPEIKGYFSPNRPRFFKDTKKKSQSKSSFVKGKTTPLMQKEKNMNLKFSEKKQELCDPNSSFLSNFKSLRQFKIRCQFQEYTSFSSQHDTLLNFFGSTGPLGQSFLKSSKERPPLRAHPLVHLPSNTSVTPSTLPQKFRRSQFKKKHPTYVKSKPSSVAKLKSLKKVAIKRI